MKESKFNLYLTTNDGTELLFNAKTCALAIVDTEYKSLLNALKGNCPLSDTLKKVLDSAIEAGFIIENNADELTEINLKRNYAKFSEYSFSLTIAPTLMCNFVCPYCYETRQPGFMDANTQKNLVEFAKEHLALSKEFNVTWYGGEPLLAKEIIYSLSSKFLEICAQKGVKYTSYIITNGSLLTQDDIEMFKKHNIVGAQITVDGPKNIHNVRRKSRDGKDTFEIILKNINLLLKSGLGVTIRINLDKTNDTNLEELFQELSKRLYNKRVKISFGHVSAYTEACKSIESTCYDNIEYAHKILEYYAALRKYGFDEYNFPFYPMPKFLSCCAETANSFVVDQKGYLYKCWNEVGQVENAIANINDEVNLFNVMHAKWLGINPLVDKDCKDCLILPACMGGCPFMRLQGHKKSNLCDLSKFNLNEIVKLMYDLYLQNNENPVM